MPDTSDSMMKTQEPEVAAADIPSGNVEGAKKDLISLSELAQKFEKGDLKPQEEPKEEAKDEEEKPEKAKIISKPKEEEPPKENEDRFSKKFAALSKRERALHQKEKEFKEQQKRFKELADIEKKLQEDPYSLLEERGHQIKGWTDKILNGEPKKKDEPKDSSKDIETIKAELDKIKQLNAENEKKQKEAMAAKAYERELESITGYLKENKDNYPLTNVFGDSETIYQIRAEKYAQDAKEYGEEYAMENLVSIEEAAKLAEEYRAEAMKEHQEGLRELYALIPKYLDNVKESKDNDEVKEEDDNEPKRANKKGVNQQPDNVRTLTNKQQTTVPKRENKEKEFKSDFERIQYIADKFM